MIRVEPYTPAPPLPKTKTLPEKVKLTIKILFKLFLFFGLCFKEFIYYLKNLSVRKSKRKEIAGNLVLVTGGANGLGRELCLKFAENGCNIIVVDIDSVNAEKTAKDVQNYGIKSRAFRADVSDYITMESIAQKIKEDFGPVDILVNNAGIPSKLPLSSSKPEDIKRIMDVNILSYFYMIRLFLSDMIKQKKGHIVSIASGFAFLPAAWLVPYTTSKAAVKALMEGLNEELFIEGHSDYIQATCVYPVLLNTRKEIVDALNLNDFSIISPDVAAEIIVDATKSGLQHVAVPQNRLRSFILMSLMPSGLRRAFQKAFYIGEKGDYFVN